MRSLSASHSAGLCSSKRYNEAQQVYKVLRPRGYELKYNTYQSLVNCCLCLGDLEAALDVFRDLQNCGMAPNKVTYCGLISALGKQRRRGSRYPELAYELWQELRASADSLDAAAVRVGMKACVEVGRITEAEQLLAALQKEASPAARDVRTYNILLRGYAQAGNKAAMQGVMDHMQVAGVKPSCVTYNTLIDGHVRAGALAEARACMVAAKATGLELDAWSYTTLMKGCLQSGDLKAANGVLREMRGAGIKPTCITYSTLIDGHVRTGDLTVARQLLEVMIADGERPSAVTYNSLLRGYVASQQPDALQQALQVLDDMQRRGVSPAVDTFNTLMSAAVAAEDPNLALELHRRLQAAGLRPDGLTYTVLVQAHARLGQLTEAVGTFESLSRDKNASMDVAAYNAMVDAFARAGEMEAAERMLQSTCKFASQMGLPPPVEAFGAVVTGYVRLKLVAPAVDAVRRFHAAGGTPDVQMLDQLVDLCVRTGEFKVAMQAVRALELMGTEVDKDKYKSIVMEQMKRQSKGPKPGNGTGMQPTQKRRRSVHLERFKFWLGLPNTYYDGDSSDAEN